MGDTMDDDDVDAWRMMMKDDGEKEDVDFNAIVTQQLDDGTGVLSTIDKVAACADQARSIKNKVERDERKMVKSNHMITLQVVLHDGTAPCHFRVNMVASAQFGNVEKSVVERMGKRWNPAAKLRLSWLTNDGVCIELTQSNWRDYFVREWCTLPWVVHAHDADMMSSGEMPLVDTSTALFERYDINRNGLIERAELTRMIKDIRLERFECSSALIERFAAHEFDRLDLDTSGGIDFGEFTKYVTKMTAWMRMELMVRAAASKDSAQAHGHPQTLVDPTMWCSSQGLCACGMGVARRSF